VVKDGGRSGEARIARERRRFEFAPKSKMRTIARAQVRRFDWRRVLRNARRCTLFSAGLSCTTADQISRGKLSCNSRDSARSASTTPPVWQTGQ
jgi:hypothetical protein